MEHFNGLEINCAVDLTFTRLINVYYVVLNRCVCASGSSMHDLFCEHGECIDQYISVQCSASVDQLGNLFSAV